jgi:hypothetical protein
VTVANKRPRSEVWVIGIYPPNDYLLSIGMSRYACSTLRTEAAPNSRNKHALTSKLWDAESRGEVLLINAKIDPVNKVDTYLPMNVPYNRHAQRRLRSSSKPTWPFIAVVSFGWTLSYVFQRIAQPM